MLRIASPALPAPVHSVKARFEPWLFFLCLLPNYNVSHHRAIAKPARLDFDRLVSPNPNNTAPAPRLIGPRSWIYPRYNTLPTYRWLADASTYLVYLVSRLTLGNLSRGVSPELLSNAGAAQVNGGWHTW